MKEINIEHKNEYFRIINMYKTDREPYRDKNEYFKIINLTIISKKEYSNDLAVFTLKDNDNIINQYKEWINKNECNKKLELEIFDGYHAYDCDDCDSKTMENLNVGDLDDFIIKLEDYLNSKVDYNDVK